jgi:hypothetical protein
VAVCPAVCLDIGSNHAIGASGLHSKAASIATDVGDRKNL